MTDILFAWAEKLKDQIDLWDYHDLGPIREWPDVWKELYQMHGNGD